MDDTKIINELLEQIEGLNKVVESLRCRDRHYILQKRLSYASKLAGNLPRSMGRGSERFRELRKLKLLEYFELIDQFDLTYNITLEEKCWCMFSVLPPKTRD